MSPNRSLNLEQLEGEAWPDPGPSTHLVMECHRLRRVPLEQLTVENLRLLLGQKIGFAHLIPLALEQLERDPWLEGDCYAGDVLVCMLHADPAFWIEHPEHRARLDALVLSIQYDLQHKREVFEERVLPAWQKLYGD